MSIISLMSLLSTVFCPVVSTTLLLYLSYTLGLVRQAQDFQMGGGKTMAGLSGKGHSKNRFFKA